MLQFLNPIWLFATGAILIPLAIHLWNVKKGKTLKIGSIQLLGESSKQNSRSLRLQDLWLLLLRCLLLIILALLLAAPLFIQKAPAEKVKGWILLDKVHIRESSRAFKTSIDSLQRLGFETHYFNPGFEDFELADSAEIEKEQAANPVTPISYWSLARALDDQLPARASAYIFTNNRLERFKGTRPQINSNITWQTYSSRDSIFNSIAAAYMTAKDSLRIVLAQSTPGEISYSPENTSVQNLSPAYKITGSEKKAIRFNATGELEESMDSSATAIDTGTLRIALFTDKHPADMAYVRAALEAVQDVSQRRISILSYREPQKIPAGLNWLFWLSEAPVNSSVRNKAANIFSYQPGKALNTTRSSIQSNDIASSPFADINLYKITAPTKTELNDRVLWEDETGKPLLSRSSRDERSEFKFCSRFDPEWNDLVWDPRFPEALLQLVFEVSEQPAALISKDSRTVALSQIIPAGLRENEAKSERVVLKRLHLDKHLWVLFILLLALERWLSFRQKSVSANG